MIAVLLMIIGGGMVITSIVWVIKLIFQPLKESYEVVINREDDYTHYTSPSRLLYLQEQKRRYIKFVIIMFTAGVVLFFTGLYMQFGSRGFEMLLSFKSGKESGYEALDPDISESIDENGDFVAVDGKSYSQYVIVRGNNVYVRDFLVGGIEQFEEYIPNLKTNQNTYLIDDYASSAVYKAVLSQLLKNSIDPMTSEKSIQ